MKNKQISVIVAAFGMLLTACGGGGGSGTPEGEVSDAGACQTISGGDAIATLDQSNCPGCTASNEERAVDGNSDTAGTVIAPSISAGFAGLRGTAQPGVVFGGGSVAAAVVARTSEAFTIVAGSLVLRTYLDGNLQEEHAFSNDVIGGDFVSGGAARQYSFTTTKPFDAVAFGFSGTAENYEADYYAFCGG